jgi:hypothetical protein
LNGGGACPSRFCGAVAALAGADARPRWRAGDGEGGRRARRIILDDLHNVVKARASWSALKPSGSSASRCPTASTMIARRRINARLVPQPGQNTSNYGVPAIRAARIVGDHSVSRLAASCSFQRSTTPFASARASASATCRLALMAMSIPRVRAPIQRQGGLGRPAESRLAL